MNNAVGCRHVSFLILQTVGIRFSAVFRPLYHSAPHSREPFGASNGFRNRIFSLEGWHTSLCVIEAVQDTFLMTNALTNWATSPSYGDGWTRTSNPRFDLFMTAVSVLNRHLLYHMFDTLAIEKKNWAGIDSTFIVKHEDFYPCMKSMLLPAYSAVFFVGKYAIGGDSEIRTHGTF